MKPSRSNPTLRATLPTLAFGALALAPGLAGAQGNMRPHHDILVEDVSYSGNPTNGYRVYRDMDRVGDVDGDGRDDFVLGNLWDGPQSQGCVTLISGRTAELLWVKTGSAEWRLGSSVSGIGDVSGDGVPDVIAGAPYAGFSYTSYLGKAIVYSGVDGEILYELDQPSLAQGFRFFGRSVSGIADLNADGRADFLVGAPSYNGTHTQAGLVVVYSGDGTILRTLTAPNPGNSASTCFGWDVRDGGDLTGDGVHDILVGNPFVSDLQNQLRGGVYVYSGATGAFAREITGPDVGCTFGAHVDGVGDQDGDGRNDILVSTGTLDAAGQCAYVISGRTWSVLWSASGFSRSSRAGDVNGDGIEDFVIGDPGRYGLPQGRLIAGRSFATLSTLIDPRSLISSSTGMGQGVSAAGDVNQDGYDDVLVALGMSRVFVYLGRPDPSRIRRIEGEAAGDQLGSGTSVAGAGDVDGDGYADVIVGSPRNDAGGADAGAVRVVSGLSGREILSAIGAAPGDQFGWSVSSAGDVNRDGFLDVIVGAPWNDNVAGIDAGSAHILSGRDGSELQTLRGVAAWDSFGHSVADAGDVNGDGFADVIVGAPQNGPNSGSATIYSGSDWQILYRWFGGMAEAFLGYSVSGAGDVNGDGLDDVIVGAYGNSVNFIRSGSVTVYSGFDGNPLFTHHGESGNRQLGYSVDDAGDVNADGYADVVVTGYNNFGVARVYAGPDGALLHEFTSESGGFSIYEAAGAGDVNGDGLDDLLISGEVLQGGGAVRVYTCGDGGVQLYHFGREEVGDWFGDSISAAGDVNGDGRDDVIIGAPYHNADLQPLAGGAYVYSLGYPGEGPKRRAGKAPTGLR